ncbi:MAG: GLUG motif-containing protein [Cloacibacillus sp.]
MYGTLQNIVTSCDVLAASTRTDDAVSSGDSETGTGGLKPGGGGANSGRGYAGGLVGVASGGNILNCVVEGTVKSNPLSFSYAGGLVGYASNDKNPLSFFKNCAVLARSILTKAGLGSGLSMGMLKADSEKCYWLKDNSNDKQPENSGTALGIKVSAVSEIPVSAVLRGDSLSSNKPANRNFEVELASYPKQSSEGEIKCEWSFKDKDIKIFSVNGLKATVLAPTKGVKQFIVKITGINGIAPDDTENSLVLCGSVKVKGAGALITHSAPVTDTVEMSNAAAMMFTKSADGKIELTPEAKISFDAEAAAILKKEGSSTGKETVYEKLVAMSPVIRGTITEAGETGIFKIASSDFDYRNANVFFKMTNDGHYCKLSPQSVSSDLYNGEYASDDNYFYIGIDDGGPLDLDGVEDSKIVDPVFAAKIKGAEPQSLVTKDSSGGCNGGFSFLALLMLTAVPILLKHRKQR